MKSLKMGMIKASIGDALLTSMWRSFWCASFNLTASLTFYAVGLKKDSSFISLAIRFLAQAAARVVGVKANLQVIPEEYRKTQKGPLKLDLHTGFLAEGILTFVLSLALLLILFRGPKNPLIKLWLMASSTVGLVTTGSKYLDLP
ncbi:hypothetical protein REPUB_Repub09cG0067100 [Reevesia pubescens]